MMSSSRFVMWLLSIVLLIALARTPVLAQQLGADFGGLSAPSNGNGLPAAKPTLPPQSPLPFPTQFPAGVAVLPDLSPPGSSPPDFPPVLPAPSWPSTANGPLPAVPPGGEIGTIAAPSGNNSFPSGGLGADMGGFGGPGDRFGGPGIGSGGPGYGISWYPSRSVSGQATDFGLLRESLSLGVPVWRDGGDAVMLRFGLSDEHFFTDAILPNSHQPFPTDLWNVNLGLMYFHVFENGWTGGLMTSVGSPSDQPFDSLRDMTIGLMANLQVPAANMRDKWTFGLMYSPTGAVSFPIPMVSYAWNPSDTFRMNIGLPFAMMWRPTDDLTLNLSYTPITSVNALATYRLAEQWKVYGGYQTLNESYLLADRAVSQDRFFEFEDRLLVGVRWEPWRRATVDLNSGYAFDRHFGEGKNQTSDLEDEVNIAPGAFVGTKLNWKF
jgi:hypothetical protein